MQALTPSTNISICINTVLQCLMIPSWPDQNINITHCYSEHLTILGTVNTKEQPFQGAPKGNVAYTATEGNRGEQQGLVQPGSPIGFPKCSFNCFPFSQQLREDQGDDLRSSPWPPHWTWGYTGYFLCISTLAVKSTHTPSTVNTTPCRVSTERVTADADYVLGDEWTTEVERKGPRPLSSHHWPHLLGKTET